MTVAESGPRPAKPAWGGGTRPPSTTGTVRPRLVRHDPGPHPTNRIDITDAAMNRRRWTGAQRVRLSVLMPAYNEAATILLAVAGVLHAAFPCEIELIVVDDGSTDATWELLQQIEDPRLRICRHPRNFGKGAAIQTALSLATGSHIVPFDADLEYDPNDVARMLEPVVAGRCDVVFGTRMFGMNTVYQSYRFAVGNRLLTLVANLLFDSYVNDLHTCLKLMPRSLLQQLTPREVGFGLDTEITAKLLKQGVRPFEVPITYHGRSVADGKKITWRHGVECLQILGRVRFAKTRGRMTADILPPAPDPVDLVVAVNHELEQELAELHQRQA